MRRRDFVTLIGGGAAAAWPFAARAQHSGQMRRIGVLQGLLPSDAEYQRRITQLTEGLRDLGWTEGQNFVFEFRYPEGQFERLPALADELVQAKVDVIVTQGTEAAQAARNATHSIPIVMAQVGDAVGAGLIASLARPGGNITGLTLLATETSAKRLELLKEILPNLSRVAVLWNLKNASHQLQWKAMEHAGPVLNVEVQSLGVLNADDLDKSVEAAVQARAEALITMDDVLIQFNRVHIVELAMQRMLPVIGEQRQITESGALLSYAPSPPAMWRQAATYIDKIFKGTNPADLPVEQPTRFELVVNLKTAKALSLHVPQTVLSRADDVIE